MIVRGNGAYVYDEDGNRLLDAGSHLGACQIGHGRADVAKRITDQVRELEFIALDAGISHIYVAEPAERLAGIVLCDDPVFSFTNSGSELYEPPPSRSPGPGMPAEASLAAPRSFRVSAYTAPIAASAATGIAAFKTGFGPLAPDFLQTSPPTRALFGHREPSGTVDLSIAELEALIEREGPETVAAVIAEPVAIPGAVKIPHSDYFMGLRGLCDRHGILLIVDEVVCGFGRTGRMFGAEHFGAKGDIVTYAKGLTSGYVPMGAVAVSGRVNEVFQKMPLLHLNTYAGHPVACAAALAALDITEDEGLVENAAEMEAVLRDELERMRQSVPRIRDVSVIGLLSSVVSDIADVADPDVTVRKLRKDAYDAGVLVRVARDGFNLSTHFYPALVVEKRDIENGVRAMEVALRRV